MRPYAGVDYDLTLYQLPSRLQHICHGQPYSRVGPNPLPESTLSLSQGLSISPQILGIHIAKFCSISMLLGKHSFIRVMGRAYVLRNTFGRLDF
jgi:hypothetical protein